MGDNKRIKSVRINDELKNELLSQIEKRKKQREKNREERKKLYSSLAMGNGKRAKKLVEVLSGKEVFYSYNDDSVQNDRDKLLKSCIETEKDGNILIKIIQPLKHRPQTYIKLYENFQSFRNIIEKGSYIYCNGYMVLFSKECLKVVNGKFTLTDRFYKNFADYCICLETVKEMITNPNARKTFQTRTIKKEYVSADKVVELLVCDWDGNFNDFNNGFGGDDNEPDDFGSLLKWLMKRKNVTIEKLSNDTGLSPRTISRMREYHGYGKAPKLSSVMRVIIGMSLGPYYGLRLTMLAGYYIIRGTPLERAYQFLIGISHMEQFTVHDANNYLSKLKLPKL